MNIKYKEYIIELIDETWSSLDSSDKSYKYETVISDGGTSECPCKYGIKIRNCSEKEIYSCLIIGTS